ncbi:magnesium transporter [Lachnospiraceae bacterium LCP25S3_G4]
MNEEIIRTLLVQRRYKELKTELEKMYPVDIAESLREFDDKESIIIFRLLIKDDAADVFTYLDSDRREILINALTDSEIKEVMDEMYLDDTVDVLEEMPANVVDRLLEATDDDTRRQINIFLKYPERSAGSIMTVEYAGLNKEMTVADAILKIRQVGITKETIYTLYVTEKRRLIGYVTMKDLLTSSDSRTIEDIMDSNIIYAETLDDQEDVSKLIKKYGLIAIPIVDKEMCMVGIVTVDDAMLILQGESTEDITRMAAVSPSEESYFGTSVWGHAKNRSAWLIILMLSATITGSIINGYEDAMSVMPILVSFITMIMGTGGNCGSQSATLMIRGLAIDEIQFQDIFRVIFKEFQVAIVVGVLLSVANGLRIYIMYQNLTLSVAVGLSLMATILLAKMVGCTLPLIAEKLHLDPAIMAAPLITTIVDAGAIMIYFAIVTRFFHLN